MPTATTKGGYQGGREAAAKLDLGPAENPRHVVLGLGSIDLWFEAALCMDSPQTLDCSWAKLGCAPADLDDDGATARKPLLATQDVAGATDGNRDDGGGRGGRGGGGGGRGGRDFSRDRY